MTRYTFKGKEISHIDFIAICRKAGIHPKRKKTYFQRLEIEFVKGNRKATEIMNDLRVCKV